MLTPDGHDWIAAGALTQLVICSDPQRRHDLSIGPALRDAAAAAASASTPVARTNVAVIIQGTIRAEVAGGTITLQANNGWTNAGIVEARTGAVNSTLVFPDASSPAEKIA